MAKLKQKGTVTLELLIAFSILILNITAVTLVINSSQYISVDIRTNQQALFLANNLLEEAMANSALDFNLVNTTTPILDDIYQKNLFVEPIDFFTKKVTSIVAWQNQSRNQTIELATLVTNKTAVNGGDTCSSTLLGDWSTPTLLGSLDLGQSVGATDVDVFANIAFITANTSVQSDYDFYIVDVSNPDLSPLPIIASVDTGPGINAVQVTPDYAYVANTSINGHLQIIDIKDPNNPSLVNNFKLTNVTGSGVSNSIFYLDGFVYLGLTSTTTGPEFSIIDVSNPSIPTVVGGYDIGHQVNSIYVKDTFAYIASPNSNELIILDVSDPSSPTLASNINLPDNSANGKSIDLVGDTIFLGRTVGASPTTKELQMINVTDKITPIVLSSADINHTINAVKVRDNLAFMTINKTSSSQVGFQIWDLDTMTLHGSTPIEQTSAGGMDCEGNIFYVAQRHNKALQIIGPGP